MEARDLSVTDIYVYSELQKSLGSKASNEWLRQSVQKRLIGKKSPKPAHASSSSSPNFVPSFKVPYDDNAADPTHVMVTSTAQHQTYRLINLEGKDREFVRLFTATLSRCNSNQEVPGPNINNHSYRGNFGLIFTDAAHSVIQERDSDFQLKRWNSSVS